MAPGFLPSADRLMRKATTYLARQSASTARVRLVLERAVRRSADEDLALDEAAIATLVDPVIERLERAGVLDDAVFARQKAGHLAAKGKPAAAIKAELKHRHGVSGEDEALAAQLATLDPLAQAMRWAQRRRLGPFRPRDRAARRDRDIASLARAGFSVSVARAVIDGDAEVWPPSP